MSQQIDPAVPKWFVIGFPFFFVGMWLGISTLLGLISGWFALQNRYSRDDEQPLYKRRIGAASMGPGVHYGHMLTLAACPSGLRVSAIRLMAPFQRPFTVPWNEIRAEEARSFLEPVVRLRFGHPDIGTMKIGMKDWERLAHHATLPSRNVVDLRVEPVSAQTLGAAILLQWVILTGAVGTFFFFTSLNSGAPGLSIYACYGFPAVVFGVGLFLRWLSQLR